MNIVEEILNYVDTNTTNTKGVDLYIGSLPDDVDNGIMLVGTGGGLPELYYDLYDQGIEIWSRNKNTENGFNKLKEVFTLLHRKANISTANAYIYFIHSTSDVESIGRDLNGRALHKIIIRIIYRDNPAIS